MRAKCKSWRRRQDPQLYQDSMAEPQANVIPVNEVIGGQRN